jgi:GNAT superfamily N-acetyltransferase
VAPTPPSERVAEAIEAERRFVLALGGYALEISGATLVTHEKLPVPRFNFVDVRGVAPGRQAALVERALDHYFQRALRPTFRLPDPVPGHLDRALRALGFRPRAAPLTLLVESGDPGEGLPGDVDVGVPTGLGTEELAAFWSGERDRPELRAALDVALHHPNPDEELVPVIATLGGARVTGALLFRYRRSAGIHLVATQPSARGRGAASALVAAVLRERWLSEPVVFWMTSDEPRAIARLSRLGLSPAHHWVEYELPRDARLPELPVGPVGPPRWRPPRRG